MPPKRNFMMTPNWRDDDTHPDCRQWLTNCQAQPDRVAVWIVPGAPALSEKKGFRRKSTVAWNVRQAMLKEVTVMEMLLMGLCMAVFGTGVAAAAFGAATRSESRDSVVQPKRPLVNAVAPTKFFSESIATPGKSRQVPIEDLLLQIENHVRMEQAAAESFLAFPTQAQLHSRTNSPFVN